MAGELMLINPRRRRKHRRKMSALQRSYFGGGRRHKRRSRRRVSLLSNPVRRHRRRSRRVMRLRRNPMPSARGITSQLKGLVTPALGGAAGAIAVDAVLANFGGYLPQSLTTGNMAVVTRIAAALLVGWGISKVAGRSYGSAATVGAVTIVAYGFLRPLLAQSIPQLGLAAYPTARARLGAYPRANARLGYIGPGMSAGVRMGSSNLRPVFNG